MSPTLTRTGAAVAACAVLGSLATRDVNSLWYRTWRADDRAGLASAPYAVWCGFATALSGELWRVNRG